MNKINYELRMFMCELLLELIFKIVPKEKDGIIIVECISDYYSKLQYLYPEKFKSMN